MAEKRKKRELTEHELHLKHLQWLKYVYSVSNFFQRVGITLFWFSFGFLVFILLHFMFIQVTREVWAFVSIASFGLTAYVFGKWIEPEEYLPKG